jgi:hypothetical protein
MRSDGWVLGDDGIGWVVIGGEIVGWERRGGFGGEERIDFRYSICDWLEWMHIIDLVFGMDFLGLFVYCLLLFGAVLEDYCLILLIDHNSLLLFLVIRWLGCPLECGLLGFLISI